jgi:hypothetical protein
MKTWAEKRKREMEAIGETGLAEVFALVVKMCELEEHLRNDPFL